MDRLSLPLRLDRQVQLWSYEVSHSVLLLRANSGPGVPSRMDLMFRAVRHVNLRHRYAALVLDVMDTSDAIKRFQLDPREVADRFVFTVAASPGELDYVVAGSLFFCEDDLADRDPSPLDRPELEDHVVRLAGYR